MRATRVEALVLHPDDRDVRLDRRERVVGGLRARVRERVEERGLAGVRHPDDAHLHHRPKLPSSVPRPGAGGDVGRVVHAEVEAGERHRGRRAVERPGRQQPRVGARRRERRRRVRGREREAGRRRHQVRQVLDRRARAADRPLDRARGQIRAGDDGGGALPARPARAVEHRPGERRARARPRRARPASSSAGPSGPCQGCARASAGACRARGPAPRRGPAGTAGGMLRSRCDARRTRRAGRRPARREPGRRRRPPRPRASRSPPSRSVLRRSLSWDSDRRRASTWPPWKPTAALRVGSGI